jgi:hypothetical protein
MHPKGVPSWEVKRYGTVRNLTVVKFTSGKKIISFLDWDMGFRPKKPQEVDLINFLVYKIPQICHRLLVGRGISADAIWLKNFEKRRREKENVKKE